MRLQTDNENLNIVKADLELKIAELQSSELKQLNANEFLKEKIKQLNCLTISLESGLTTI